MAKKNYFINFLKSFSIVQVLIVSIFLFAMVFAGTPDFLAKIGIGKDSLIKQVLDGLLYVGFGGVAIIGLSAIKSSKISFIDFVRVVGFIGGIASGLLVLLTKTGTVRAFYLFGCGAVCFVEFILRGIIAKPDAKVSGYKAFMSALANKWHLPALMLAGVGLGVGMIFLTKNGLPSFLQSLSKMSIGIAAGVFIIIVVQTIFTECRPTILDAIINIITVAVFTYSVYFLQGMKENNILGLRDILILNGSLVLGTYLRAIAYPGSKGKPSRFKVNRYYAALTKKYDVILPLILGFGVFGIFYVVFGSLDRVVDILNMASSSLASALPIDRLQLILAIVYLAVVALCLVGAIFGKVRDDQVTFSDLAVFTMSIMFVLSFGIIFPIVNDSNWITNTFESTAGILAIVGIGVNALFAIIFVFIRWRHFDDSFEYNTQKTEEFTEAEEAEDANDDYAGLTEEEIAALEAIPEAPAEEEVVYVDEEGNILSAEEVEAAQAEEIVEEEVIEEAPAEEIVEEEVVEEAPAEEAAEEDDDLDALLAAIPEKEEAPAEEEAVETAAEEAPAEETAEEDEDLDALLAAIPEKEEAPTEATEEVAEEAPADEEAQARFANKKSDAKARLEKLLSYYED